MYTALSERMSSALDDAGINMDIVMKRRQTFMLKEMCDEIMAKLLKQSGGQFYFGSQSEGTTTPGLQSDKDMLRYYSMCHVILDLNQWVPGKITFMMLKDPDLPPQQFILQVMKRFSPEPETRLINDMVERDSRGRILLKTERWRDIAKEFFASTFKSLHIAGPSISWSNELDFVNALGVTKLLPEVNEWICRHRPGHWPTQELLEDAKTCMCFLVPVGHPFSDTKHIEWRLSPNLIERKLMFSLNIVQIKCYVFLKMIKKSLFYNVVEDGITSFHCKTILFYTLERTHAHLWQDCNLAFLVKLCLHTLQRCLKHGVCPHYIIGGVNLFDSKLSVSQRRKMYVFVSSLLKNNLQGFTKIQVDNIGLKLSSNKTDHATLHSYDLRPSILHKCICRKLEFDNIRDLHSSVHKLFEILESSNDNFFTYFRRFQQELHYLYLNENALQQKVTEEMSKSLFSYQASFIAAMCIRKRTPLFEHVLDTFKYSIKTDVASNHLKLASILYCCGHLHSASFLLRHVERCFKEQRLRTICPCDKLRKIDSDLQSFRVAPGEEYSLNENNTVLCVHFLKQEAYCVPPILLYEMNKTGIESEINEEFAVQRDWTGIVCIDAPVLLHYMQFLTYGGLGDLPRQMSACLALEDYITQNPYDLYHVDTAINLMGHCVEISGDLNGAMFLYSISLRQKPKNNAAHWHMRRLTNISQHANILRMLNSLNPLDANEYGHSQKCRTVGPDRRF
ncbi:hypothetical protein DPMN_084226 [Dreissena polymorpha]|uniref:Mab-21-like HhH/H2TH-like domain-containing protein n=2 Tax=Dreissena polymorpha TaxID=45954 RepID=A0A9D3YDY7_DREPO|nr:hypothetical protein DPMN_084226 [Dreissena polymorpha]